MERKRELWALVNLLYTTSKSDIIPDIKFGWQELTCDIEISEYLEIKIIKNNFVSLFEFVYKNKYILFKITIIKILEHVLLILYLQNQIKILRAIWEN